MELFENAFTDGGALGLEVSVESADKSTCSFRRREEGRELGHRQDIAQGGLLQEE
jgi:hypothetical protein